jgi:hypothetical protein
MRQFSLAAQLPPISLLSPAADAAGRTSAYRSLKSALKAYVIVHINQGNAATVLLSLLQAKDVSGGSSKAIAATPIWSDLDTATSDALVSQTAAATYTTDAALKDKIVVFEILPEQALDVANGFYTIAISTGASNAANITEAILVIDGAYEQATPPSALVN